MERTADIDLTVWRTHRRRGVDGRVFAATLLASAGLSALMASWLPLQVSIVTVFLFAGPHNWFELRYFLMRLPVRFGRSRSFFLTAFAGIGILTFAYISMPLLYNFGIWPRAAWPTVLAFWNTLLLLWLSILIWQRGKQKPASNWTWTIPVALGLASVNWLAPEMFSLAIVYLHPLVALWFLDRHLRRTRPEWLRTYHRCLLALPLLIAALCWQVGGASSLPDDNGLFWRITQHAGAELLPNVSARLLVTVHLFLEMMHYGVWIVALPLIAKPSINPREIRRHNRFWNLKSVPLARHPRGFPRLVATALLLALFVVVVLWFGFSLDYSTTRDLYFTVAIAHVLAEAPFLLRTL